MGQSPKSIVNGIAKAIDAAINDPVALWDGTYREPMQKLAAEGGHAVFTPAVAKSIRHLFEPAVKEAAEIQARVDEILAKHAKLSPRHATAANRERFEDMEEAAEEGNFEKVDNLVGLGVESRMNFKKSRAALKAAKMNIQREAAELLGLPLATAAVTLAKLALSELDESNRKAASFGFTGSELGYVNNIAACALAVARTAKGSALNPRDVFQMLGIADLLRK